MKIRASIIFLCAMQSFAAHTHKDQLSSELKVWNVV
jgi:hypothetical protein